MATIAELMVKIGIDSSKVGKGMNKVSKAIEGAEGKIMAAGAIAGGAMVAGFMEGLNIERANDKLAASLALTEDESERVGGIAGDLYANAYGGSIEEVNSALAGVISRTEDLGSISDTELSNMGAAALDYAATFDQDVARVTQVAGQMVSEGLAEDFTHAFDIMAAGSQQTAAGMQGDLLDASDEYGTFFQSLGFDGEQAFGLLAAASEKGMFGIDKTGDAVKEFTIRATEMNEGTATAFENIGLNAEEMGADFLAGGDQAREAFDKTIEGILGIEDPMLRAQTAVDLFGTPIEDLTKTEIPEFLESLQGTESGLGDVGGAAADLGDTLNDNTATSFTELGRTAQQELIKALEPMIPKFQQILDFLIKFAPHIMTVIGAIIALVAVIKVIRAIIIAVTVVQWLWNAAVLANPITWIILAIIALIAIIVLLVVHWDTVVAALTTAWNWIKNLAITVWNAIADFFVMIWEAIKGAVLAAWNWVKETIVSTWNTIKARTMFVVDSIKEGINAAWEWIKETSSNIWNGIKDFFSGIWDSLVDIVVSTVDWINEKVTGTWNTIKENVSGALEGLKSDIRSVWDWAVDKVSGAVDDIKGFFSGMWDGISQGLKSALNGAIGLINGAIGGINTLIDGANKVPGVNIPHIPSIPYLAEGGDILSAGWAIVGEAGPEMLKMPRGAQVRPLDDEGGGGGVREVRIVLEGDEDLVRMFRRGIRNRGGLDVVFAGR